MSATKAKSLTVFLSELAAHNVGVLCDVRSNPIKRKKGFSKKALSEALAGEGIGYRHFPALCVESALRKNLETDEDRQRLFRGYLSATGSDHPDILAIRELASESCVALMCFEADHSMCHRHVTAQLVAEGTAGVRTVHI